MVNLSDISTAEDLATPESVERFNQFYTGYVNTPRAAGMFKVLHVWYDGRFHSCDFGIVRDTLDDLAIDCAERLLSFDPATPLPVQPRDAWWDFWRRPLKETYMHYPMRTFRRSNVFCVVRG